LAAPLEPEPWVVELAPAQRAEPADEGRPDWKGEPAGGLACAGRLLRLELGGSSSVGPRRPGDSLGRPLEGQCWARRAGVQPECAIFVGRRAEAVAIFC